MGLIGGAIFSGAAAKVGGLLLLLSAAVLLAALGFNFITLAPALLMLIGGGLGLASADFSAPSAKAIAHWRAPWFFGFSRAQGWAFLIMVALIVVSPFVAVSGVPDARARARRCSPAPFNLMLGYVGLLSFGHAAFFGAWAAMSPRGP